SRVRTDGSRVQNLVKGGGSLPPFAFWSSALPTLSSPWRTGAKILIADLTSALVSPDARERKWFQGMLWKLRQFSNSACGLALCWQATVARVSIAHRAAFDTQIV